MIKLDEIQSLPKKELSVEQLKQFPSGTKLCTSPQYAPPKDHEIRELINKLKDVAIQFHDTQQLRERITRIVRDALIPKGE